MPNFDATNLGQGATDSAASVSTAAADIRTLINTLCPDGVEWKALGECINMSEGYPFKASDFKDRGKYSIIKISEIKGGSTIVGKYFVDELPPKLKPSSLLHGNEIVVGMSGSTGNTAFNQLDNAIVNQRIAIIRANTDIVTIGFLKHLLVNDNFRNYCLSKGTGMQNNISKTIIENFRIPVPPLAVQAKIVQILDKFTELAKELAKEQQARRAQYEYYRDWLLDLAHPEGKQGKVWDLLRTLCPDGVEWKTLGDIFVMRNGYTPSKSEPSFWEGGTIPWFRMDDIRSNGNILADSIQHVTPAAVKGKLFPAGSIILATTATIGVHALLTSDSLANQRFTVFTKRELSGCDIDMKFMFYYFFIVDEWCKKHIKVSSFPAVDVPALAKLKVPVPPLAVQAEIVRILDQFSTLAEDITAGLPAEIAARQTQYEYYRNQLLSFKKR